MSKFNHTTTPPTIRVHAEDSELPKKFAATSEPPKVIVHPEISAPPAAAQPATPGDAATPKVD